MKKMRTVAKAVAGFAALAFVLSGCIKMDMDMKVKNDGKIDGSAIVALLHPDPGDDRSVEG